MSIATLDAALAGMQPLRSFGKGVTPTLVAGRPASLWGLGGNPGAGAFDTTLNGVTLTGPQNGQIARTNPGAGNAYLARLRAAATQPGTILLLDRLWHNGGFTITAATAQNITSPAWPARDVAGSTNGDGVLLGLEVSAAAGAAAPTITIAYTNQANTAARSAVNYDATQNSPAAGAFYRIGLQAGDTGVRSVQSLTLSASWVSGTINLVAYKVLAELDLAGAFVSNAIDAFTSAFQRIHDGAVPFLVFVPSTTTASNVTGSYVETQG